MDCIGISDAELLKYAIENDMVDISSIKAEINMRNRREYLSMHNYDIWQGNNELWYTYLPDEAKGRILKKRKTKLDIENLIVEHYKSKDEEPILKNVFKMWIDEKLELGEIANGTYDRYENDFKRFFNESELIDMKVRFIGEDELEYFIRKSIVDKKLTQKAYANMRTIIIGIFKYSKKKKFTQISISTFFKDLDLSRRAFTKVVKNEEDEIFSEDERDLIINYINDNPTLVNLGILLAFQTGIRVCELSTLKFSDVLGNTIHIQRMETKYKDRESKVFIHDIKEFPKSEAGDRYIIITNKALDTISRIRKVNSKGEFMMQIGTKRIWTNTFNDIIYGLCQKLNLHKKSMHKIRRAYGTTLIDGDVDEKLVMNQMGHSDIATTKKFYYYSNKSREKNEQQINSAVPF